MRGLARAWAGAIALAALGLAAGVASAARLKNESLKATGVVTYSWQGDEARGCVQVGVCDIRGELILRPTSQAELFTFGAANAQLSLGASGTARVLRGGPSSGECVDAPDETLNGLNISLALRGGLKAILQAPPEGGRCAGPLASDLNGVSIPVSRTGGTQPSFDLRGTRTFGAGPFTVTLVSTLMLRPLRNAGGGVFGRSFATSSPPTHTLNPIVELAQLRYRVAPVSTSIQTLFDGTDDGSCVVFDSCGARGSLNLTFHPSRTVSVFASRIVHRRPSRAQVLHDLRAGRLALNGFSKLSGTVTESYTWGDGSTCQDTVPTPSLQLTLGFPGPGGAPGRIPVTVTSNTVPGAPTLRTHCPGPADADLLGEGGSSGGGQVILASGWVTPGELLSKHLTLNLTEPSAFTGLGYAGSRQGSVRLNLTLVKVSSGTGGGG